MLNKGVFRHDDWEYTVYEVSESGFYRIDILRDEGILNVDTGLVVYSKVQKKLQTYTFGNATLGQALEDCRMTASGFNAREDTTSEWEDGKFVTETICKSRDGSMARFTRRENSQVVQESYVANNDRLDLYVLHSVYGVKDMPPNIDQYELCVLSKDTIAAAVDTPYYPLSVLKRKYDLRHIEEKDICVADTVELADKRLREYDHATGYKGFDTETTGLDINLYGDDKMVGIILGESATKATYFPFRHEKVSNLPMSYLHKLMKIVGKHADMTIAHNKKFDREVMLKEGYDLHIKWDSMWLSMILNPVFERGVHGLKHLVDEMTGEHFLELEEIFTDKKAIDFGILDKDIVNVYACPDGYNVIAYWNAARPKLPKKQEKLLELECVMADICADMEYWGIRVDVNKYEKQYTTANEACELLLKAFRTLTHEDRNINSADVLRNLIYTKMKVPVLVRTKTKLPSVSSNVIKLLASKCAKTPNGITEDLATSDGTVIISAETLNKAAYPAMVILQKYKEYVKLITAFYARFERTMKTGRVFFWINQWGAATGRQSSPMHQLPPQLKDCILPDSPDKDFWGPDYSQVELRMIAYLAQEKDLIELASDPDNDIHRIIGSLISGLPMWKITPKMRSEGKRRNFGVVYLISAYGLAAQMYGPGYTQEQLHYAEKQLSDFYARFGKINAFIKYNADLVQKQGYMETKWFHRQRMFPQVFDPNIEPAKLASALRMANNVPVQGNAADLMKLAEVQMYNWIYEKGWNECGPDGFPRVRMMLSIHDELIISADRSIPYEEIIEMITKCMDIPVEGAPPFFVQPAMMDNWGGHSDDSVAMPIRLRDKLIEDYHRTGRSVINKDNYVQVLADYRRNTLRDYMNGLIQQYGPDPKNVGAHVRHPSLTFDLLDLYSKDLKQYGAMEQEDLITKATELYMSNATPTVETITVTVHVSDKDRFNNELENLVNLDNDGNPIYQEYEEDDDTIEDPAELKSYNELLGVGLQYAWYLGDAIILDGDAIANVKNIDSCLATLFQGNVDDGLYKVLLLYGGQLKNTGIRLDNYTSEMEEKINAEARR